MTFQLGDNRSYERAIIAVARMILTCIYHMLVNGEEFNPVDREREEERRAAKVAADDQERMAIELLASRGNDVSHLRVPA